MKQLACAACLLCRRLTALRAVLHASLLPGNVLGLTLLLVLLICGAVQVCTM